MERLASEWAIHIVSFEKPKDRKDSSRMAAMRARLDAAGISWTPLAYHKSPSVPATTFDIATGAFVVLWLALRRKAPILHARSYVPALMATLAKRVNDSKLIFDIRGFWADERIDGGLWPKGGALYRTTKRVEELLIATADHMVTLTHASARELAHWPAFEAHKPALSVIPTCADLDLFRPRQAAPKGAFILGYVGSIGTWYLFEEIVTFYLALCERRPDARLLFVNRNEHDYIREGLARRGVALERFEIVTAEHREVPLQIARMHAAAAIIRPSFSKIASAPTKLAEYLGCGVPCVGNVGVGDIEEILEERRVGVTLSDFSVEDHRRAVDRLIALLEEPDLGERCVTTARQLFSLEAGVAAYRKIYLQLYGERGAAQGGSPTRLAPSE
jgi:glycosyltransferase involved in cell wall biosynthesis